MASDEQALLLKVSADVRGLQRNLEKAQVSADKALGGIERRATGFERKIADTFGRGDIGRSLDKVFDASRFAVLEEGGAKLRLFGSALEPLGGIGLAAAAGLVAVGAAVEQALELTKFAAETERTAKALGLTTTQVQEFAHVFSELNIPVEKGDEALAGLEKTIGLVEQHLARAQTLKVFTDALKISPDQLRGWGTIEEQLPHILDAVAKLDAEGRAGVASRLKVDPEVLNSLVEGRDRIRDLIAEAHQYGLVLDEDMIRKGAEAGVKLKNIAQIIDINMKTAFADLIPVIVGVGNALADAVRDLNAFIEGFKKLEDRNEGALNRQLEALEAQKKINDSPVRGAVVAGLRNAGLPSSKTDAEIDTEIAAIKSLQAVRQLGATLGNQAGAAGFTSSNGGDGGPTGGPHARGGRQPHDDTAARLSAAEAALESATRRLAEARASSTDDTGKRATFEKAAIDAEFAKAEAERVKQSQAIADDKTMSDANKRRATALLWLASLAEAQAANARKGKIDQDAAFAIEDEQIKVYQAKIKAQIDELEAQKKLAASSGQRRDLDARILALQQQLERDLRETLIDRDLKTGRITQAQHDSLIASGRAGQTAETQSHALDNLSPLQQFAHDASAADLGDELQAHAVTAMKTLNEGLVDAILNGNSLKDTFKNLLKQFGGDVLKDLFSKAEGSILSSLSSAGGASGGAAGATDIITALLHFIPGFAGGTDSAPGGLALVGEHGPELVNLRKGAQVIPNLSALTRGSVRAGAAAPNINVYITHDMRGAVGQQELQSMFAQSEARTRAAALDGVRRSLPGWQSQNGYERG